MDLILTVVADPNGANMQNHTKVFDQKGGSLGRSEDNNWVLPDPERVVSSRHASIAFEGGQFFVIDSSTNGTYLNDAATALKSGSKQALNDGDVLIVGEYRLKVTVRNPEKQAAALPKGLGNVDFLDESSADKTVMSNTNFDNLQSGVAKLDDWLEPGASNEQPDQWGFLTDQQSKEEPKIKPMDSDDLLGGIGAVNEPVGGNLDPLSAFQPESEPQRWDDDDDWWKSGSSEGDNSPANQQSIDVRPQVPQAPQIPQPQAPQIPQAPQVQVPVPPSSPQPVAPQQPQLQQQPEFRPQQPPVPPSVEDNPFAGSAELLHGQEPPVGAGLLAGAAPIPPLAPEPPAQPQAWGQPEPSSPQPPQTPMPSPSQPVAPPQAPPPVQNSPQQAVTPAQVTADAQALASSLGLGALPEAQVQQLVPEAAAIVQETVNRLIDLMRARTSVKNELRVQRTMIQVQDNNPLKFSASAVDAMQAMFGGANSAYMAPQDAVKDSFDDLSDHQVAVLSGMRAAYEFMLQQFSPSVLERRLNTGGGHLVLSKSAKKWDAFEKYFQELQRDSENTYRRLFGEEFANAYEQQLSELKNTRAMTRRGN